MLGFYEYYTKMFFYSFCSFVLLSKKTKKKRYMKKTYVSPLALEVNVATEAMLAASLNLNGDKTVDTSAGGQLSEERRGEWGNLWK